MGTLITIVCENELQFLQAIRDDFLPKIIPDMQLTCIGPQIDEASPTLLRTYR